MQIYYGEVETLASLNTFWSLYFPYQSFLAVFPSIAPKVSSPALFTKHFGWSSPSFNFKLRVFGVLSVHIHCTSWSHMKSLQLYIKKNTFTTLTNYKGITKRRCWKFYHESTLGCTILKYIIYMYAKNNSPLYLVTSAVSPFFNV